ncbi:hypothetical protein RS030_182750 [Cryptosporidium xiaoi]|uniref:Uncharacterized protein n=1 Tax=Cryptosporidium xiaoi TaxID=659607 RepID=A0AAV9Y158_9CRYT
MPDGKHSSNFDLEQKTILPIDDDYEFLEDAKEAIEYLRGVREEASGVKTSIEKREETETFSHTEKGTLSLSDEFRCILEYDISQKIRNIRSDPNYSERKDEIIEYINSLRSKVSDLTEVLETIDIVTKSNWDDIINSDQTPCVTFGKWNSSNWCTLLEYFSDKIKEHTEYSFLNTKVLNWILLSLISIHSLDSYNPNVSYSMQEIKRYLESTNFKDIRDSDYFRIESITIIIKYIFNQQ